MEKFPGSKIEAPNTIIAISGMAGSGKNTVSNIVAKELNYSLVAPTFKDLAQREGIPLMEFQKRANKDFEIDKKFDEALQDEARTGNCVVATWLGPWMAPGNPFRVWLKVDENTRAKRISKRDNISPEQAKEHIKKRDADNLQRYKKVYSIDISDHSDFDLILDASSSTPQELANELIDAYQNRG